MKLNRTKLTIFALGCSLATSLTQDAPAPVPIPYTTMQVISNGDSAEVIAEKAAKVLPRANQTDWMRLEWTFFLHFGPNSFHGVEWGSGREEPSLYNPTAFDADQWVRAMKDAGGKLQIQVGGSSVAGPGPQVKNLTVTGPTLAPKYHFADAAVN